MVTAAKLSRGFAPHAHLAEHRSLRNMAITAFGIGRIAVFVPAIRRGSPKLNGTERGKMSFQQTGRNRAIRPER